MPHKKDYAAAAPSCSQQTTNMHCESSVAGRAEMHLLALKDVLVELLLQALVGQVDAQLLEGVLLEALKTVDVQDAYDPVAALPRSCIGAQCTGHSDHVC